MFLAIGLLDFLHAASYKEMPDFLTPASPEKPINFWLVSRLLLAIRPVEHRVLAIPPRLYQLTTRAAYAGRDPGVCRGSRSLWAWHFRSAGRAPSLKPGN
ncbi:MASE3 domain-containing protein [Cupriavidus basilensis]